MSSSAHTDIKEHWEVVKLGIHFIILFAFRQCIYLNNQTKPSNFNFFLTSLRSVHYVSL